MRPQDPHADYRLLLAQLEQETLRELLRVLEEEPATAVESEFGDLPCAELGEAIRAILRRRSALN